MYISTSLLTIVDDILPVQLNGHSSDVDEHDIHLHVEAPLIDANINSTHSEIADEQPLAHFTPPAVPLNVKERVSNA